MRTTGKHGYWGLPAFASLSMAGSKRDGFAVDAVGALVEMHGAPVAEPSQADMTITKRLREALALIDVRVLDHLVIGDEVVSFAERGLI